MVIVDDMDVISALSFGKIFKNRIDLNACDIVKRRLSSVQNNLAEPAISLATIVLIDFQ
jgi:pantothenate kinase